ncbi:MAG TPA: hypothetical protein GX714_02190, partial [Chloroflexi bacterium]|nr:hypothetical protein [Chloroflexota bacterium]
MSTSRHNPRLLRCDTPEELRAALTAVHADPDDLAAMLPQGRTVLLRLDGVSAPGARVLREHLRARGAAAALSAGADRGDE